MKACRFMILPLYRFWEFCFVCFCRLTLKTLGDQVCSGSHVVYSSCCWSCLFCDKVSLFTNLRFRSVVSGSGLISVLGYDW